MASRDELSVNRTVAPNVGNRDVNILNARVLNTEGGISIGDGENGFLTTYIAPTTLTLDISGPFAATTISVTLERIGGTVVCRLDHNRANSCGF